MKQTLHSLPRTPQRHSGFGYPAESKATGIEAQVCADIADRQQKGIAKYGTTVADNPLSHRAWLQHAYEESLDHTIYLKAAIATIDSKAIPHARSGLLT